MIELLLLVKVSAIVAATTVALAVAGRKSSAATRHLMCTLAIAGLLALPILSIVLPAWSPIQLPPSAAIADQSAVGEQQEGLAITGPPAAFAPRATAAEEGGHHVLSGPAKEGGHYVITGPPEGGHYVLPSVVVWFSYATGVLLLTIRLLVDRFKAQRLVRHATAVIDPDWQMLFRGCADRLGVRGRVRLLRSEERATPMAIGIRHPAIVLPGVADEWSSEMRRAVLLHELAHVARRDCLTQTAAAAACALYWMHPGSWWLARRLRIERELACDDRVLSAGTDAHDYAGHLLELAYALRGYAAPALAVGMAAPRQLEARLLALLDRARIRTLPTRLGRLAAIAIFAMVVTPIAAASVGGQPAVTAPQSDTERTHDLRSDSLRGIVTRFLSVDYWRTTAIVQMNRLAIQLNYLSEMRQLGYSMADVNLLFRLRQHGVTPEYVRALAAEGLSGLSTEDLLTAVRHGISADYVSDLKGVGYQSLDLEGFRRLRSHGVDGDFIRDLAAVGFTGLSTDDLVRARSHGISPEYIGELLSLGYQHLSIDDLTRLRSHGVTGDQIRVANERAGTRLSVDQLTVLASHGWKQ